MTTIQQKLASGKVILVTGTPIFDDQGEIEMVVNNVRDITELLELREALKEKEKKVDLYNTELERLRKKNASEAGNLLKRCRHETLDGKCFESCKA